MKRQRRTFTNEFKTEIVKTIIDNIKTPQSVAQERNIAVPLLMRWKNDYIASSGAISEYGKMFSKPTERRRDYQSVQELKAKIAELYMKIESLNRKEMRL